MGNTHNIYDNMTLVDVMNAATEDYYPNIASTLQLLLTLPVGSCTCERSFSSLRRLKIWIRSIMGETRLNGLALLYIHSRMPIVQILDPHEIMQRWDGSLHRRIALAFSKDR